MVIGPTFDFRLHREEVLTELVRQLLLLPPALVYLLWRKTVHVLAGRIRNEFLSDLIVLLPVVGALGEAKAIEETMQAVIDVERWWP